MIGTWSTRPGSAWARSPFALPGRSPASTSRHGQKAYHRHSGFPGGLRTETAQQVRDKHPERLIERAVRGMLATNRLRDERLNRLKVYVGTEHPHAAQQPKALF
jgi:large subunit ribosomal protein L13